MFFDFTETMDLKINTLENCG